MDRVERVLRPFYVLSVCVVTLFVGFGCSSSEEYLSPVPANGTVKSLDGIEVSGLDVRFIPEEPNGTDAKGPIMREARGMIDDEGHFTLMTQDQGDGVAPGRYRVILASHPDGTGQPADSSAASDLYPDEKLVAIPPAYTRFNETPWTADVTEGGPNEFEFELQKSRRR